MFGLGGGELIVIVLLALLLVGPKDFPKVARQMGRWVRHIKFALGDFKEGIENELRMSEEESSKKEIKPKP